MLISEFSTLTGLKQTTIRFYIGMGLLRPQRVTQGVATYHQNFCDDDVQAVKTIGLLQSVGCSLAEIAALFKEYHSPSTSPARLDAILNFQIRIFEEKQLEFEAAILSLRAQRQKLEGIV